MDVFSSKLNTQIKQKHFLFNDQEELDMLQQRIDSKLPQQLSKNRAFRETQREFEPQVTNFTLETVRDRIKERKFEEKKKRFDQYVSNILPEEINSYLKDYFDSNFKKIQDSVEEQNKKITKEIGNLENFTQFLKQSEEATQHDYQTLKQDIDFMKEEDLAKRKKIYETMNEDRL